MEKAFPKRGVHSTLDSSFHTIQEPATTTLSKKMYYIMLNSLIRVGIAEVSMVSAYMTIVAMELRIASIFQDRSGCCFFDGHCILIQNSQHLEK